jgi:rod shape-determining protein MreC
VIARSPSVWNRVFFIDKGSAHGVRVGLPALSGASLVGKITEAGPGAAKVALVTDPLFRIGAIVQRTRDQGVLYGTPSGECRLKYLPLDSDVREGDLVETAGSGNGFPKAIPIGAIERIWKEPGQVYRVARVKPAADLSRIEEVLCVE